MDKQGPLNVTCRIHASHHCCFIVPSQTHIYLHIRIIVAALVAACDTATMWGWLRPNTITLYVFCTSNNDAHTFELKMY